MSNREQLGVLFLVCALAGPIFAQGTAAVVPVLDEATATSIRTEGIDNSQAMRLLYDLTSKVGHRLTGSDNFTKACDWALAEFSAMGLQNVHKEKWGEWRLIWNRGTWKGRIVAPITLELYVAAEAWTASTNGMKKGRVVRAPKDSDGFEALAKTFAGAWVYAPAALVTSRSAERRALREQIMAAGAHGFLYMTKGDAKFPTRVRVFGDHNQAMGKLEDVPTTPQVAVQSDHAQQLEALLDEGKEVVVEIQVDSEFKPGPIELNNVVAEIPGTEKPDEVVIVCGHLDSWHQAQGCTDNGTGTTSTMEAARILAKVGVKPTRTIRFILWGGEEEGLLGSVAYVKQHRAEMDKISCAFNHDTGTNWAQSMSVSASMLAPMQRVFAPVMQLKSPEPDFTGPVFNLKKVEVISGGGGSDHASFIAARVPGLEWGLRGRSDYFQYTWHSQWDRFDVAIPEYQRHTSTVIALAALGVANLPELLDHSGVRATGGGRQSMNIAGAVFNAELDGLKFTKVEKGGRADGLGIQVGDVIRKAEGKDVEQLFELFAMARDMEGKETMDIGLVRGKEQVTVKLKLVDLRNARGGRSGRSSGSSEAAPGSSPRGSGEAAPGSSPRGSGEAAPGSSPRGSVEAAPGSSPRGSVEAAPGSSPRGSVEAAPGSSPRGSVGGDDQGLMVTAHNG